MLSPRLRWRLLAGAVADLVTVRQVDRLFGAVRQQLGGHDKAVSNQPVHARQGRCAWQPQVADLHGRRAVTQDGRARAAGERLQVHQHIDAGLGNEFGCGEVVHTGQAHMVIHSAQQALALRHVALRRPAKGEDFKATAVMQFQQFGDQKAHRVVVQVTRQVAQLDAPRAGLGACLHGCVKRCGRWLGHTFVHKAHGGHELQRGVVAHAHHGQCRCAHQLHVQAHVAQRLVERPNALLLPHMHVVLDDIKLRGTQAQTLFHQGLRLGQPLHGFKQARTVVQRVQVQLDVGGHRRCGVRDGQCPLGKRFITLATSLHQVAQVQVRGREVRVRCQGQSVGLLSFGFTAQGTEQSAPVETRHMLERCWGVLDPGGVQLRSSGRLIGALQRLGVLHHLLQSELTRARTRHGVCSMGSRGSWGSAGLGVDHVGHEVSRVGVDETDPRQRPLVAQGQ